MRGKWTEGEWRLAELHKLGLYDNDGSAKVLAGHGDDSVAVASVAAQAPMKRGQGSNLVDPERDANAQLMVAAPALYGALAGLLPHVFTGPRNWARDIEHWESERDQGNGEAPLVLAAYAALSLAHTEPSQGETPSNHTEESKP